MAGKRIKAWPDTVYQIALNYPCWAALLLGVLSACGLPPLSLWPLTVFGVAGLAWLLFRAGNWRKAAWLGWLFGFGHFILGLNWMATAFTYQDKMPAVLGWIAVPLLALCLGAFPACIAAAARLIAGNTRFDAFGAALAGCWIAGEWLRSWIFTGFAWNPLGLAFLGGYHEPGIAALLPWFGTYALSGLVVATAVILAQLIAARAFRAGSGFALLLAAGMYVPFGTLMEGDAPHGTLSFTLVQPNTRQEDLNNPVKFEEQFLQTAMLTRMPEGGEPERGGPEGDGPEGGGKRLILWPESGIPDYLRDGYPQRYYNQMTAGGDPAFARFRIGQTIGEGGVLLTGAVDLEVENGRAYGARNAVTAIDDTGKIIAGYSKAHLVPFGEYLPLRWLIEPMGAARLVAGTIDFIPGSGPETIDLGDWGQAGIQICYEVIFSGQIVDPDKRPDYIFNPSNDGWYGWWGPPQHLAQTRLRAIEEGLPVLRSTTTGISAVIDANGIVRDHIPMHRAARIDGVIPPAKPPTLFAKLGNSLPLGWALLAIALSIVLRSLVARKGHGS